MKIILVDIQSKTNLIINKDLSGGFGTSSNFGKSFFSKALIKIKKDSVKVPILMLGYLSRILKDNGHEVEFSTTDKLSNVDLYIIYSSLIEHSAEINFAKKIKKETDSKVAFVGPFATFKPEIFLEISDFVVAGEPEQFAMNLNDEIPKGLIASTKLENLDDLPFPDWKPFKIDTFSYSHYLNKKNVFTSMLTSRGCPYSCSYYCPYPGFQGDKMRYRSVDNVLNEIEYLIDNYNVRSILFRDPIYTLDMKRAQKISEGIIKRKLNIEWVCETHFDRLNRDLIMIMQDSGLKGINVGIESPNEDVLKNISRKSSKKSHQEDLINFSEKLGVKIGAFYILGTEFDDKKTIEQTIEYSKKLNTSFAQFTLSTPYPGTKFFDDISKNIYEKKWDNFDIYTPTFSSPNFSSEELSNYLEKAYFQYYFRVKWILKFIKSKFGKLSFN